MIIRTFILVNISWFFDRADTVGQAFHMMKLSVTKFTPSQLLLIPAGKEGTAFTPYALAILAVGCVILFIVSVLQERGMKIRETLSEQCSRTAHKYGSCSSCDITGTDTSAYSRCKCLKG